jgi:hypothetical protein
MKKILMALCLVGLGAACKSTADVSATAEPCAADCKMECCAEKAGECSADMKAECQKSCEGEAKVCPVTGKPMN